MPSAPVVEHTIEYLEKLHSNIRVVSSPGLFPVSVSHHQKFVVVDRSVAVLGGVDWTFCRWDTLRCASLALSPLPLIFSYKSEKSLYGKARHV